MRFKQRRPRRQQPRHYVCRKCKAAPTTHRGNGAWEYCSACSNRTYGSSFRTKQWKQRNPKKVAAQKRRNYRRRMERKALAASQQPTAAQVVVSLDPTRSETYNPFD